MFRKELLVPRSVGSGEVVFTISFTWQFGLEWWRTGAGRMESL